MKQKFIKNSDNKTNNRYIFDFFNDYDYFFGKLNHQSSKIMRIKMKSIVYGILLFSVMLGLAINSHALELKNTINSLPTLFSTIFFQIIGTILK